MSEVEALYEMRRAARKRGDKLVSFVLTKSQAERFADEIRERMSPTPTREEVLKELMSGSVKLFGLPVRVDS